MADLNAEEAIYALHQMGWLTRTDPTVKPKKTRFGGFQTTPPDGRADAACHRDGLGVFIEFKCARDAWIMGKWEENQRNWAAKHAMGTGTDYYIWLRLGTAMPHLKNNPDRKMSWLVPYKPMIYIVGLVESVQGTLPYRLTKHHARKMRELKYDAVTLFAPYALEWIKPENKPGRWNIPETHVFYQQYHVRPSVGVVELDHVSNPPFGAAS